MSIWIALAALLLGIIECAHSQNLHFDHRKERDDDYVWTYSVTRPQSTDPLTVRLAIPNSVRVRQLSPISEVVLRKERLGTGNLIQLKFIPTPKQQPRQLQAFTFEIYSLRSVTKTGDITWTIEASPNNFTGTVSGPAVLYDATVLRPVFAVAGSVRIDDVVDFKIEDDVMLIQNDSSLRPSLMAGVLLKLFDFQTLRGLRFEEKKTFDFILSLEFANATSRYLDGFMFGVGLGVNRYLELYGGVSIRIGQEISPGFRQSAILLVSDIQEITDTEDTKGIKSNYERFHNLAGNDQAFDGFPTINPLTNTPIFPGSPLIDSTNKAIVFGVALPVDILNLIRGQ